MPITKEAMSVGLVRQRRNLIVVCMLLWFLQFGQVEIEKISFLGIEFKNFSNPSAIYVSLWLIWLYFLIRYYQYFSQEGIPNLKQSLKNTIDKKFSIKLRKLVLEAHPDDIRENCNLDILRTWKWTYYGQTKSRTSSGSEELTNYEMKFTPFVFWKEILVSIWSISINQSAITDYILPLALSIYILINGYSGWDGSIYNVVFN